MKKSDRPRCNWLVRFWRRWRNPNVSPDNLFVYGRIRLEDVIEEHP